MPLPAIAHVKTTEGLGHFVVLYQVHKKGVLVADPASGIEKLSRDDFCQRWTGYLLLVVPEQSASPGSFRGWPRTVLAGEDARTTRIGSALIARVPVKSLVGVTMTFLYFKLAFAGILGGLLLIAVGLDMYWQGALAILVGLTALALGIRASRIEDYGGGPYTPEDFPCPEPGRAGEAQAVDRGNEVAPGNDEVAFAVVIPKASANERALKAIGQALQVWQSQHGFVRRIVGLEQLLEGKFPETYRGYILFMPVCPGRANVEKVALVFVAPDANTRQTAKSLH